MNSILLILKSMWQFDGIVIVAPYPYKKYEKNGYFQRILDIDKKLKKIKRAYINVILNPTQPLQLESVTESIITFIEDQTVVINFSDNTVGRILVYITSWIYILRCRRVYFHSVYRIEETFGICLYIPMIRCFFDVHGAVSAEHNMRGESEIANRIAKFETLALKKAAVIIYVSDSMHRYFQHTTHNPSCESIVMPITSFTTLPEYTCTPATQQPVIVYAGGTTIWQQCEKMAATIGRTYKRYTYRIYCSQPEVFKQLLPADVAKQIDICATEHDNLLKIYPQCHYGLILRQENIVNQVACPTKLIEYLAYGIVPVVESPNIGDFVDMGMRYVELERLENGMLPQEAERVEMARANRHVFERLLARHEAGHMALLQAIKS